MHFLVNGIKKQGTFQRCTKCISDSTIPGIVFNSNGVCNFCELHNKWCKIYPNDARGEEELQKIIKRIKRDGKNKKYDCVIGISGGRDSTYILFLAVKKYGLRPLAVHFNDGFDNPVGGENMLKATKLLGVELITITSDWRLAKDLKIAFIKASTPDLNQGTDVGIGAACYGVAYKKKIKHILFGQSFRTEGIKPLSWAYIEGEYLKNVHALFGNTAFKRWEPSSPAYNFGVKELGFYTLLHGIKLHAPLYYENYVRKEAEAIISKELGWVYPGAHYYDDLYWSLITYVHRVKFNIDFRLNSYSALVRDGQMNREEALEKVKDRYVMEDPKIIDLCLKRLGISKVDFELWMNLPPLTFRDYKTGYNKLRWFRPVIKLVCKMGVLPEIVYDKYFLCGE